MSLHRPAHGRTLRNPDFVEAALAIGRNVNDTARLLESPLGSSDSRYRQSLLQMENECRRLVTAFKKADRVERPKAPPSPPNVLLSADPAQNPYFHSVRQQVHC